MPWKLQDQQIFVYRPTLTDIPALELPAGYIEQPNSDALLESWVGLLNAVFGGYTIDQVRPQIESPRWDPGRVKLVAKDDKLVALSMAWHEPELWPQSGFVFWVAVSEPHHGRGLGSFVLTRALKHMARSGLSDAGVYNGKSGTAQSVSGGTEKGARPISERLFYLGVSPPNPGRRGTPLRTPYNR